MRGGEDEKDGKDYETWGWRLHLHVHPYNTSYTLYLRNFGGVAALAILAPKGFAEEE